MRKRTGFAFLAAAIGALLLLLWFRTNPSTQVDRDRVAIHRSTPVVEPKRLDLDPNSKQVRAEPPQASSQDSAAPSTVFEGRLEVHDRDGRPDAVKDGSLFLDVWLRETRIETARDVTVKGGVWKTTVRPDWSLVPVEFRSRFGRRATAEPAHLDCSSDSACAVIAVWMPGTRLTVLTAETHEMVADVTVSLCSLYSNIDPEMSLPSWSSEPDRIIKGNSPIELPCLRSGAMAYVSAPGRETKRISFCGTEGSRTVSLSRAAPIELTVDRSEVRGHYFVQAWRDQPKSHDSLLTQSVNDGESRELQGLPAVPLVFMLSRMTPPSVIDVLDVQRPEKDSATGYDVVHLCAACPRASHKLGSLRLTVDVHGSDGVQRVGITSIHGDLPLHPARIPVPATTIVGQSQQIVIDNLLPGEYGLSFFPPMDPVVATVKADATTDLSLAIPPRTQLIVDVLDSEGQHFIRDARVMVRRVGSIGSVAWSPVELDTKRTAYCAMLTNGEYELTTTTSHYPTSMEQILLTGAELHHVVRVTRSEPERISIRTAENKSGVILGTEAWVHTVIEPIAPTEGRYVGAEFPPPELDTQVGQADFLVSTPGRYRIIFPSFDGFEDIDPVEIDVERSQLHVIELNLVPRL